MSHNETAAPSPKIAITPATDPAPPWTGEKFTCVTCGGEFQLEAADRCTLRLIVNEGLRAYDTPPCPTEHCGTINVIELRVDETQEANPS